MSTETSIAIVGAGPYALSLAAHLRARNIDHRVFGSPMQSWAAQMPWGMLLKSEGDASNLYDPEAAFTLKAFCIERGIDYRDSGQPVRLDTFCDYGLEFQKRFVPGLEDRQVVRLSRGERGFQLVLDDGQSVTAGRVVVAVGVGYFSHVPQRLAHLPEEVLTHSSRYGDLSQFRGRDVVVIGGGASALDIAALLNGAQASVLLIARKPALEFHVGPTGRPRPLWQRIRHPRSPIGHSLRSLLLAEAPLAFHYLPEAIRLRVTRRHLGPAGGWFIKSQVADKVPMLLGCIPRQALARDGRVELLCTAADGSRLELGTEHVIAATGYRVDVRRLGFIDEGLRVGLLTAEGAPVLSSCFESSVGGLYFVGPASANSFGSVMRFACGARFTANRLSAHLGRVARRRVSAISRSMPVEDPAESAVGAGHVRTDLRI